MADYRPLKISIWDDDWFYSLNPEEKTVWFFLLTNKSVHVSGIYQLPKPLISPYVGVPPKDIDRILKKFEADGKIVFKNGWVFIKNYLKNQVKQFTGKDNILKSIRIFLQDNPDLVTLFDLKSEAPYKPLLPEVETPCLNGNGNGNRNVNGNGNLKAENEGGSTHTLSPEVGDNSPRARMTKTLNETRANLSKKLSMTD